jgi:hypothetical protein
VAEGEGFQGLMADVCPEYDVPSQNTVASKIGAQASDTRKDTDEKLKQDDNITLTVYFWSSVAMDRYMSITCRYADKEWLFRSIVLETMKVRFS